MFVLRITIITTIKILVWLIFIQSFVSLQVIFTQPIGINISSRCPNIDLLVWLLCQYITLWFISLVVNGLFIFFSFVALRSVWTFRPVRTLVTHLNRGLVYPFQPLMSLFFVWWLMLHLLVLRHRVRIIFVIILVWDMVLYRLTLVDV